MLGLALAAGAGTRLRPDTDQLPKALLPVSGELSILDLTLANFAEVGITDTVVVVGYRAESVVDLVPVLEQRHGVNLEPVFNDKAEL